MQNKLYDSMKEAFRYLDELIEDIDKENTFLIFSSRGSYPFVAYLRRKSEMGEYKNFRTLKHIYSVEELVPLLDKENSLINEIYTYIAKSLDEKIEQKELSGYTMIDIDEVCSGINLVERIRLYKHLRNVDAVDIYSFVSERGRNLMRSKMDRARRLMKGTSISNRFIRLKNKIEWSDNDPYYDKLKMQYPLIMKPNYDVVSNIVNRNELARFYYIYISYFSQEMSKYVENASILHELVRDREDGPKLNDVNLIRTASIKALFDAFNVVSLKINIDSLKKNIILEGNDVYTPKGRPLLIFRDQKQSYKNPFVLEYTPDPRYEGIPND